MTDVVVIGGGIVGTAAAAFLADAGATVVLVDRDGLASGASGANSGVVQHPMDPPMVPLYRETVEHYRALTQAEAGFRLPNEPAGMLFVTRHRAAAEAMVGTFPGFATDVIEGAALQRLEPTLAPDLVAMSVAIGYPVPPAASTYAYATVAERRGVTVRVGRAAHLVVEGGRAVGVELDGRRLGADQVLVAAGPWTPGVIDPTGGWRPITERWGVVVEVELADPPRHCLEEAEIGASIGTEPPADERGGPDTSDFSLMTALGVSAVGSTFLQQQPDPADWTERLLQRASSVRADRVRGADPWRQGLRPPRLDRRSAAHRRGTRRRRPVRVRGPRSMGHLDRPGVGATRGRSDAGPTGRHPRRVRSREVRPHPGLGAIPNRGGRGLSGRSPASSPPCAAGYRRHRYQGHWMTSNGVEATRRSLS